MRKQNGCTNPIFICGDSRSGTTALWQALTNHPSFKPRAYIDKEPWYFIACLQAVESNWKPAEQPTDVLFEERLVHFVNSFLSEHISGPSGRYVTGRTDNILVMDRILKYLPAAKFLLTVRHPQEAIWSKLHYPNAIRAGWRAPNSAPGDEITNNEISWVAGQWRDCAKIVIRALRGDYGTAAMVVRHESLVADPAQVLRDICEFVGESFSDDALKTILSRLWHSAFSPDKTGVDIAQYFRQVRQRMSQERGLCERIWPLVRAEAEILGYQDYGGIDLEEDWQPVGRKHHLDGTTQGQEEDVTGSTAEDGTQLAIIDSVTVTREQGGSKSAFLVGESIAVDVRISAKTRLTDLAVALSVLSEKGLLLFGTTTFEQDVKLPDLDTGESCSLRFLFTNCCWKGLYHVDVMVYSVSDPHYADFKKHVQNKHAAQFVSNVGKWNPASYLFFNPISVSVVRASENSENRVKGLWSRLRRRASE